MSDISMLEQVNYAKSFIGKIIELPSGETIVVDSFRIQSNPYLKSPDEEINPVVKELISKQGCFVTIEANGRDFLVHPELRKIKCLLEKITLKRGSIFEDRGTHFHWSGFELNFLKDDLIAAKIFLSNRKIYADNQIKGVVINGFDFSLKDLILLV